MSGRFDNNLVGDITRVVLLVAFFSAMPILLKRDDLRHFLFDLNTIRATLQGGQQFSGHFFPTLVFTLAVGGLIALGVPRLWASTVAGIIYGAFVGTLLSLLASLLGASVLYLAGRSMFASVVERRLRDKLNVWKIRFQENAFWWVLYGRFFPFSNSTIMSLLCGSCRVPYSPFMIGSLIGFVPLAVVFATYGSGGVKGNMWQIGFATVLLLFSILSRRLMNKWFPSYALTRTERIKAHAMRREDHDR
jgi:uncharacterized membrane protein YdjX (TVP38/TMEM64 family)